MVMEETLCLLTPSCVGRKWLVQRETTVTDEETGESRVEDTVQELASDKSVSIESRLQESGFTITAKDRLVLSREQACKYLSSSDSSCDEALVQYLTSGPVVALRLSKEDAVSDLLKLAGPSNPEEAREIDTETFGDDVFRWSLRGAYGSVGIRTAVRPSPSTKAAERELAFFFPDRNPKWERAVVITDASNVDSCKQQFQNSGLCVIKETQVTAKELGEIQQVGEMYPVVAQVAQAGGKIALLVVEGFSAVKRLGWLKNAETTVMYSSPSSESAQKDVAFWFKTLEIERVLLVSFDEAQALQLERLVREYGFTILAKRKISSREIFSISRHGETAHAFVIAKAGAHVTCQSLIGEHSSLDVYISHEFGWLFPQLDRAIDLDSSAARSYIRKAESRGSEGSQAQLVQSVLVSALTELCKTKPAGLDAVRQLGEWLLRNNPDRDAAARAEGWIAAHAQRTAAPPPAVPQTDAEVLPSHAKQDSSSKKRTVLVLGPPGSGKGTQCAFLAKRFGYDHISTGDLLRHEVELKSQDGKLIYEQMQAGGLVDTDITIRLLQKAIRKSDKSCVLIDGFPRDIEQAKRFEQTVGTPAFVLHTSADTEIIRQRLSLRMRQDDTPEIIEKRMATFDERSFPVIEFYASRGLVRAVHQTKVDESAEQVFQRVLEVFTPEVTVLLGSDAKLLRSAAMHLEASGFQAIDVLELINSHAKTGSPVGQRIREIVSRGQRVPDEIIVDLLRQTFATKPDGKFALTSYPTTLEECAAFESNICPAKHFVYVQSSNGIPEAFRRNTLPLIDYLSTVGRLSKVDACKIPADELHREIGVLLKPRFVLTDKRVDDPELIQVSLEHASQFQAPNAPFVLYGVPATWDETHELFEHIGNPPYAAVLTKETVESMGENAVIDHLCVEGKLRVNGDASSILKSELVACLGDVQPKALQQWAKEQGYKVLDLSKAVETLPACPGTWEAQAIVRFNNAGKKVKSAETEKTTSDFAAAKKYLVQRCVGSCYSSRGVVLVNCDKELLEELKPTRVICFEQDPLVVAKLSTMQDEEEADEETLAAAQARYQTQLEEQRLFAEKLAPGSWCACIGGDEQEVLEQLRNEFRVTLYSLVAPRSEKTRSLCMHLSKEFGLVRIKVAEVFRSEVERGTAAGKVIAQASQTQRSVPLEVSLAVIQKVINANRAAGARQFILDGYPNVAGEAFPYAHDQLFGLQKQIGPVELCIHLGSQLVTSSSNKVVDLFKSMNKYLCMDVGLSSEEINQTAWQSIETLQTQEAESVKRDHWKPGDGSPEAELQQVLDRFEPKRSEEKAAEDYWEQFTKIDSAEFATRLDHVVEKLQDWSIEADPSDFLKEEVVTKALWYDFVFTRLLNMDTAEKRRELDRLAAAQQQQAEQDEQDE